MARLRHRQTGAVISVTDEKAARLGSEWEPADKPVRKASPKKAPAKKAASSTAKKS